MQDPINFDQILSALDSFTQELCVFQVWIPSLQRNITVKELNAKQQKRLLGSAVKAQEDIQKFLAKPFIEILTENCSEPLEVIQNLTFLDYSLISLKIKQHISELIEIEFSDKSEKIPLAPVLQKIQDIVLPIPVNVKVEKENITLEIVIKYPTLQDEVLYSEYIPNLNKIKAEDRSNIVEQMIADAYIYETLKCVSDVTVNGQSLNFKGLNSTQKYSFFERLPASVVQNIISQYGDWRRPLNQALTVTSSEGEEKSLEINSSLFLTV